MQVGIGPLLIEKIVSESLKKFVLQGKVYYESTCVCYYNSYKFSMILTESYTVWLKLHACIAYWHRQPKVFSQ